MWLEYIRKSVFVKCAILQLMRLHRFYLPTPISDETFDITDRELIHQWANVFRYNVGSQVILFDGSGIDYLCMITSLRNLGATVSIIKKTNTRQPARSTSVWLCLGIIKKDNFEIVVQKVTEIGVTHIVPLLCERSEKKKINFERLQKIIVEASEQSGRGDIPVLHKLVTTEELFKEKIPLEKIVLDSRGTPFDQYNQGPKNGSIAVFIGPEGGFTENEINFFKSQNTRIISLGSQILRAETAAIAISSLLLL